MITLRAPMSTIRSRPDAKSPGSGTRSPTSSSASSWFGATRSGSPASPRRSGSPSGVEHRLQARAARLAQRVRVPVLGNVARQAAGEHRRRDAAHEVRELAPRPSRARRASIDGPVLDDLGRGAERRVDEQGRRARLVLDPHEVVEDARRRQLLDDAACPCGRPRGPSRAPAGRALLSARATLMPLPPGCTRPWAQRWRRPICRFATRSVLSTAAFNVTVMITPPG